MVAAKSKRGNGTAHTNGKLNGQIKGPRGPLKQKRGLWTWAASLIARIAIWGAILTILLRCPASLETCDETSPLICKPYFHAKNAVTPHVQPYINRYAAPYVNAAKPYYDTLNKNVLGPTRQYAVLYGTPLVTRGQHLAKIQWKSKGQPQLLRIQTSIKSQYDTSIAPHLTKATAIIEPYYSLTQKISTQVYNDYVLPGYVIARPYAVHVYDSAADFTTTKALPATYWAWGKANAFLDTAVWPQLRVVYVENVEPQLVRIGERLGRYRSKPNATSKAVPAETLVETPTAPILSSFSRPSPQTSSPPPFSTPVAQAEATFNEATQKPPREEASWNPVQTSPAAENEGEKRKTAREMVDHDLATWQHKCSSEAEEGARAIRDQVDEIARDLMSNNALNTGKSLLKVLEDTISSEVVHLKSNIKSIVETGGSDAGENAVSAIRAAGTVIKKRAQVVRRWREDYDAELEQAVLEAAEVHFQIFDETRNLALQNIGMKWAWTDGITYKDWHKYRELKKSPSDWRQELNQLIVNHPTLLEAQELSHQIENDGMEVATAAAQELARLRDVAQWKIQANDSTDNFESDAMRLAAEAAQQSDEDNTGHNGNDEQGVEDGGEQSFAEEIVVENQSSAPDTDPPEDRGHTLEPVIMSNGESDGKDGEAPHVPRTDNPTVTISLARREKPSTNHDDTPIGLSPDDSDSDHLERPVSAEETEATSDGTPDSSANKVMFGAAAQSVADRSPILDDYTDFDDAVASVTGVAQAVYSSAVVLAADRYSSALSVVSAQVHGTAKPVHEQLFSSVSAAYDGAVSAASQKLDEALVAASSGIYNAAPTPTKSSSLPDWNKVESIAAQRLNEGRLWAEIQYQSVLIALGAANATATAPLTPEGYYERAKYQYYAGLGLAQDRYSSFTAAASSAWSAATATATPTDTNFLGSASNIASAAGKSAASAASAADDVVRSAYSAASEGVVSAAQDAQDAIGKAAGAAAEQVADVAGAAAGTWEQALSRISAEVYGQPTAIGWFEEAAQSAGSAVAAATDAVAGSASSASDSAAKQFDAVSAIISELVVGKEPTYSESVMSRLSAAYATATSNIGSLASEVSIAASSMGDGVVNAASQATQVVQEAVQRARDEL